MCMSVPQIAVLATSMSTSFGPTLGSGISSSQMPGCACCLTSAFMRSVNDPELAPNLGECRERALELPTGERSRHLRTDTRLALRHHRVGETDDVDTALEQRIAHPRGERGIAKHHR